MWVKIPFSFLLITQEIEQSVTVLKAKDKNVIPSFIEESNNSSRFLQTKSKWQYVKWKMSAYKSWQTRDTCPWLKSAENKALIISSWYWLDESSIPVLVSLRQIFPWDLKRQDPLSLLPTKYILPTPSLTN